jgi:hypothetical protein
MSRTQRTHAILARQLHRRSRTAGIHPSTTSASNELLIGGSLEGCPLRSTAGRGARADRQTGGENDGQ